VRRAPAPCNERPASGRAVAPDSARPATAPSLGQPRAVLALQRSIGNRAVASLLGAHRIERPLRTGPVSIQRMPGDGDRLKTFREKKLIDDAVFSGLENADAMTSENLVRRLLDNFYARTDFAYTGDSKSGFVTAGDCSTLVRQFVAICNECFGLEMKVSDRLQGPLFIKGGGRIIDRGARAGNVDRGAHWRFDDHVWAEWGGTKIDVLFGIFGRLKPSVTVTEDRDGNFSVDGVGYFVTDPPKAAGSSPPGSYGYTSAAADRYTRPVVEKKAETFYDIADEPSVSIEEAARARLETFLKVPEDLLGAGAAKLVGYYRTLGSAETADAFNDWMSGGGGKAYAELNFATPGKFGLRYDKDKWNTWIKS